MVDYLQDFSFDFEEEPQQQQHQFYQCALSTSTDTLDSFQEPSTPLLYNSVSPSPKHNHNKDLIIQDFDESFIELDISNSFQPLDKSNMIAFQPSLNENINNTIIKGSTQLKNNYKLWLSTSAF